LQALVELEPKLPASEKLGQSTLNIGQIQGGIAANVVAEQATAEISVRIARGIDEVKGMIAHALRHTRDETFEKGGTFNLSYTNQGYGPVLLDTIPGFENTSVSYGTDIPNLPGEHKKYLYGPGSILVCHGPDEGLKVTELEKSVMDYERMIRHVLEGE